jgi:lipopolysaccharide transport system permease protein
MKTSDKERVRIYTPQSAVRNPGRLLAEMFRDLARSRELAWRLFVRDVSARYRQSALGYVWAFLPPLAATLTFVLLNQSGILRPGVTSIPYPAFVLIGTVLWQTFADAIASPLKTLTAAKPMLAKINFPREALLLSGLLDVTFNFVIRAVLLVIVFLYYQIALPPTFAFAFAGIFALICLGFMIGILLAPVALLYTDVGQALGMVLSFWMLVTPVVYMGPSQGALAEVARLNPVSPLVVTTREWMVAGSATQLGPALWIFAATLVLLFIGWTLYRLTMPILIERMGG